MPRTAYTQTNTRQVFHVTCRMQHWRKEQNAVPHVELCHRTVPDSSGPPRCPHRASIAYLKNRHTSRSSLQRKDPTCKTINLRAAKNHNAGVVRTTEASTSMHTQHRQMVTDVRLAARLRCCRQPVRCVAMVNQALSPAGCGYICFGNTTPKLQLVASTCKTKVLFLFGEWQNKCTWAFKHLLAIHCTMSSADTAKSHSASASIAGVVQECVYD